MQCQRTSSVSVCRQLVDQHRRLCGTSLLVHPNICSFPHPHHGVFVVTVWSMRMMGITSVVEGHCVSLWVLHSETLPWDMMSLKLPTSWTGPPWWTPLPVLRRTLFETRPTGTLSCGSGQLWAQATGWEPRHVFLQLSEDAFQSLLANTEDMSRAKTNKDSLKIPYSFLLFIAASNGKVAGAFLPDIFGDMSSKCNDLALLL